VLTNSHVIQPRSKFLLFSSNGHKYAGRIIGNEPSIDLAAIAITTGRKNLPAIPLSDSDAEPNTPATLYGYSHTHRGQPAARPGTIRGYETASIDEQRTWHRFALHVHKSRDGDSGGPVVANGRTVAIHRGSNVGGERLGNAIPVSVIRKFLRRCRRPRTPDTPKPPSPTDPPTWQPVPDDVLDRISALEAEIAALKATEISLEFLLEGNPVAPPKVIRLGDLNPSEPGKRFRFELPSLRELEQVVRQRARTAKE
jgi:hypothetical protein